MTAAVREQVYGSISIDELVFANRNKAYGAYSIRKAYNKNLAVALWLAIVIFVAGTASPLIFNRNVASGNLNGGRTISVPIDFAPAPSIDKNFSYNEIEKLPPKVSTFRYVVPDVRPDNEVIEEYIPSLETDRDAVPGFETRKGEAGGIDISLIDIVEPAKPKETNEKADPQTEFAWAEEMPRFAEGEDALLTFLAQNINYPELARKAGIEGKVIVNLTVERGGGISNVRVVKGIGGGCDEEAIRVITLTSNKWVAGKQNGKAVRVNVSIPIRFSLH